MTAQYIQPKDNLQIDCQKQAYYHLLRRSSYRNRSSCSILLPDMPFFGLLQTSSTSIKEAITLSRHYAQLHSTSFLSHKQRYFPSFFIFTENSFFSLECSSNITLAAYETAESQFKAQVLPFRYTSSMQAVDEKFKPTSMGTTSESCALMKVHFSCLFQSLILPSKSSKTLCNLFVLYNLDTLLFSSRKMYHSVKCLIFSQSSQVISLGMGLPKNLSTISVSQMASIVVKFMVVEILNTLATFFMKGKYVKYISSKTNFWESKFFLNRRDLSLQSDLITVLLNFMVKGACPDGRANCFQLASVELVEQGGMLIILYHFLYLISFTKRVYAVELTPCTLYSPISNSRIYIYFSFNILITQELQLINILLSNHPTQCFLLPHTNRCQLPPHLPRRVSIKIVINIIPRTMSKQTSYLLKLSFTDQDYKAQAQYLYHRVDYIYIYHLCVIRNIIYGVYQIQSFCFLFVQLGEALFGSQVFVPGLCVFFFRTMLMTHQLQLGQPIVQVYLQLALAMMLQQALTTIQQTFIPQLLIIVYLYRVIRELGMAKTIANASECQVTNLLAQFTLAVVLLNLL